ncbi:C40 family peptidase [Deinococcus apachensis]|uniref:C40 family peptidase n=1 Tax=Deinococcus apachensis TaxID=309886 RepID=UPI00047704A8|nr:C40 family peptidase [Deinococcus apachensis]
MLPSLLILMGAVSLAQAAGTAPSPVGPVPTGLSSAASGDTVTVKPGDTAYSLARAYGLTVDALLALNGLTTPELRAGQVLRVRDVPPYIAQRGDTLYLLARRFDVSVDSLLALNGLPRDTRLEVGQVLRIPAPGPGAPAPLPVLAQAVPAPLVATAEPLPTPEPVAPSVPLVGDWRNAALAMLGVPYAYGGSGPAGLDCSGFVVQVFAPLGVQLPRRSADQAQSGAPVALTELQPGDLVFFDTAGRGEVTHVGIYLGDDEFVNANSYKGQVTVDHLLTDTYWAPRLLGARRVLPPATPTYAAGH